MAKYKYLTIFWGNKIINGDCTIDDVPPYLRDDVMNYVEEHSNQSESND